MYKNIKTSWTKVTQWVHLNPRRAEANETPAYNVTLWPFDLRSFKIPQMTFDVIQTWAPLQVVILSVIIYWSDTTPPPAVRAATFSSWRMLTQGAEYEDTWALSPDRRRPKRAEAAPEEADICAVTSGEPSWGPAQDDLTHKFDTVLHLDGAKGAGLGGGVQQAVWTHETLNNNPLCRRWGTPTSNTTVTCSEGFLCETDLQTCEPKIFTNYWLIYLYP